MLGIVIGGIDTYRDLGLVLSKKKLGPPAPKTLFVDVPGGDGSIDLTDAMTGGAAYENRTHRFEFSYVGAEEDFEALKTRVSSLFHGKRLRYELPWDGGYSYTGRFAVSSYEANGPVGTIVLEAEADPYKRKEPLTFRVNAAGGIVVTLDSGRMPVCPSFEFASETIVATDDVQAQLQPGAYKVNDLWLHEGINELYLNSYLGSGNVPAEKYKADLTVAYAGNRISDLIWEGVRGGALLVSDVADDAVRTHRHMRAIDAQYAVAADSERYAVYIQYDWGDL